jgi:thiol:disulfide interchange protein
MKWSVLWGLSVLFSVSVFAMSKGKSFQIIKDPMAIQIQLPKTLLNTGENFHLKLKTRLHESYYAYADRISVKAIHPTNLKLGKLEMGAVESFKDSVSGKIKMGLKGESSISMLAEIPSDMPLGSSYLEIQVKYQACTTKFCLYPSTVNIKTPVEIKKGH